MAKAKYTRGSDGYFHANVWDGTYNANGTKHRAHLKEKSSSGALEKRVNALKEEVRNKQAVRKSDIFFQEYALEWVKIYKISKSRNTYNMYMNIVDKHMILLADIKLQDITRAHIQMLINTVLEQPRTCQQLRMTLKQIIRTAVRDKLLPSGSVEDLCEDIETPRYIAKEKRPLTDAEIAAIQKADFTLREKCFVFLIYGCGLRREEALALTPFDISFKGNYVDINKALCFDGNNPYIKEPKSKRGTRKVPMPKYLSDFLLFYIRTLKPGQIRLVGKLNGNDITASAYTKMWESIVKKMQDVDKSIITQGLTAHLFRHNYCTRLCYQIPKITTKMIAKLLGDSEKMVLDVYNHIMEEKEDVDNAIEDAVGM